VTEVRRKRIDVTAANLEEVRALAETADQCYLNGLLLDISQGDAEMIAVDDMLHLYLTEEDVITKLGKIAPD